MKGQLQVRSEIRLLKMVMSRDRNNPSLTIAELGQVITQGWMLYRQNWRSYSWVALKAYASLWIPLIGLPYYSAYKAAILRHGIAALRAETLSLQQAEADARRQRLTLFGLSLQILWTVIWSSCVAFAIASLGLIVLSVILHGISAILGATSFLELNSDTIEKILSVPTGAILITVPFWSYRRLLYAESIALSNHEQSLKSSIQHSQSWSAADRGQLAGLIFSVFCFTMPMASLISLITEFIRLLLHNSDQGFNIAALINDLPGTMIVATLAVNSPILIVFAFFFALLQELPQIIEWRWLLSSLSDLVFISALTIAVLAFWQTTKAALYYKAASKQEGLDLQFQDR